MVECPSFSKKSFLYRCNVIYFEGVSFLHLLSTSILQNDCLWSRLGDIMPQNAAIMLFPDAFAFHI